MFLARKKDNVQNMVIDHRSLKRVTFTRKYPLAIDGKNIGDYQGQHCVMCD